MRLKGKAWLLLAIVGVAGSVVADTGPEYQYTFLAGALPETLYAVDSPFMVLSDIYPDNTTYVEPGVEVNFSTSTGLILTDAEGFYCNGAETEPITLQGIGGWSGIDIYYAIHERRFEFSNTTIQGADTGIYLRLYEYTGATEYVLNNITIQDCGECGLHVYSNSSAAYGQFDANDVSFVNNGTGYCQNSAPAGGFLFQGGEAIGNGRAFHIQSGSVSVNEYEIRDNNDYDVYIETDVTDIQSHNFQCNDWGPTTTMEMQAEGTFSDIGTIYDWWDNTGVSLVDYSGFQGGSAAVQHASWGAIKQQFR